MLAYATIWCFVLGICCETQKMTRLPGNSLKNKTSPEFFDGNWESGRETCFFFQMLVFRVSIYYFTMATRNQSRQANGRQSDSSRKLRTNGKDGQTLHKMILKEEAEKRERDNKAMTPVTPSASSVQPRPKERLTPSIVIATDKTILIRCRVCPISFEFSAADQKFYSMKNFCTPNTCKGCRSSRR